MRFLMFLRRLGLSRRGSKLLLLYGGASLAFIGYGLLQYHVDESMIWVLTTFSLVSISFLIIGTLMLINVKDEVDLSKEKNKLTAQFLLKVIFASLAIGFIIFIPSQFLVEFLVGRKGAELMIENMHETMLFIAILAFPFVYRKME